MDKALIEKVYNLYFKDVYYFLLSLSKDSSLSEDLTSEVFIILMDRYDDLKNPKSIKSWLMMVAKNQFLQYLRRNKRLEFSSQKELENLKDEEDIEEKIILIEGMKRLEDKLSSYGKERESLFIMRALLGLSYKEIGIKLGKSTNWACVTYYRMKNELKSYLEVDDE